MLILAGFRGPIYMTRPTCDLIEVLLKDAASLQERDVEWENKRRQRAGKEQIEPLYKLEDVEEVLTLCAKAYVTTNEFLLPRVSR